MRERVVWLCALLPLLGFAGPISWKGSLERAETLKQERDFSAAEAVLLSTLQEARRDTPSDPRIGVALNNLGSVYLVQGKYLDAEKSLEESLPILERAMGSNHVYLAQTVLHNLGTVYVESGQYAKAERVLRRALSITNATGGNAKTLATIEGSLGVVYVRCSRYDEAKPLLEDALTHEREALGPEHAGVAAALNNLAALHFKTGNTEGALSASREALKILESQAAAPPAELARILNNLGLLCTQAGSFAEAERYYRKGLAIAEPALGADHPLVGTLLEGYGDLLRRMHRKSEAKAAERRAKTILARNAQDNAMGLTVDARSLVEPTSARP